MSATLGLLHKTGQAHAAVQAGQWPQATLSGQELTGGTVGVIGTGATGRATAGLFTASGCHVLSCSRSQHPQAPVPHTDPEDLLGRSHVVVVAIRPRTPDPRPGGRLPPQTRLHQVPDLLLAPHTGGTTEQATTRLLHQATTNAARALHDEPAIDVINGIDPHVRSPRPCSS